MDVLQSICREYLMRVRPIAVRFGLGGFVDAMIADNASGACKGTEEEVELLSRVCDDERVSRAELPKVLGRSYRKAYESGYIDRVRKLRRVGIYSKVSAMLVGSDTDDDV